MPGDAKLSFGFAALTALTLAGRSRPRATQAYSTYVEELDGSDSLGIGPELMAELVTVDHGATEGPPRA